MQTFRDMLWDAAIVVVCCGWFYGLTWYVKPVEYIPVNALDEHIVNCVNCKVSPSIEGCPMAMKLLAEQREKDSQRTE